MKKIFHLLGLACALALFASCESSEAVTRNRIKFEVPATATEAIAMGFTSYEYNITKAEQRPDPVLKMDTLDILYVDDGADSTAVGRFYDLVLSSPGVYKDSFEIFAQLPGKELFFAYPQDRKYINLSLTLCSPCLNGIADGVYHLLESRPLPPPPPETKGYIYIPEASDHYLFSICDWESAVYFDCDAYDSLEMPEDYSRFVSLADSFAEGTVTVKRGIITYDVDLDLTTRHGFKVTGRYTGIIPNSEVSVFPFIYY